MWAEAYCVPASEIETALREAPTAAGMTVEPAMLERCIEQASGPCDAPLDATGVSSIPDACRDAVRYPDPCGGCADGQACGWTECGTTRCAPLPTRGQPCGLTCADGYACIAGTCSECQHDGECDDGTCVGGLCEGVGDLGDPCSPYLQCADELACLSGACVATAAAGDDCTSIPCVAGTACIAGRCTRGRAIGDVCDARHPCRAGDCLAGRCGYRESGDPCTGPRDCRYGCGAGVCLAEVGEGESCESARCAEGLTCRDGEVCTRCE